MAEKESTGELHPYRAARVITLPSGHVAMTVAQARRRLATGMLRRISEAAKKERDEDVVTFSIGNPPLQIKAGEAFAFDGELPKSVADDVEDLAAELAAPAADLPAAGDQPEATDKPEA